MCKFGRQPGLADQVRRAYQSLVRDMLAKPVDLDVFFATLARLKVPILAP